MSRGTVLLLAFLNSKSSTAAMAFEFFLFGFEQENRPCDNIFLNGVLLKMMKNFIEYLDQRIPHYEVKPEHFLIDVYIAYDKTVIIIGQKDNNFTEWLSVGHLNMNENSIGGCINDLVKNTPLPVTASLYWEPFEKLTGVTYEELKVFYLHVRIAKDDERHLIINGNQISKEMTDGEVQKLLCEFYNQEMTKLRIIEEQSASRIMEELKKDLGEIKRLEEECPELWALNLVADEAEKIFKAQKNKYMYSQDKKVRRLLYDLYKLKSAIYNKYMTAAR